MNLKFIFLLKLTLYIGFSAFSQTYVSQKSSYSDPETYDEVFVDGENKIIIDGNKFFLTLPPNNVEFSGTFKREMSKPKNGESHEILKIDGGGLIDFGDDLIWVNLYATDFNNGYTFFLDNWVEPTEEEKRITQEKIDKNVADELYKTHIEIYGKFTADCMKDGKVKIGMKAIVIPVIMGQPNSINETETANKISRQYVYDNQYIYSENGIVTTIQTSK